MPKPPKPPKNQPPKVNAGADFSVTLPSAAVLLGAVTDDMKPNGVVESIWSKVSGPGEVSFANAVARSTSATFSMPGSYVLRLTGTDGVLSAQDVVAITVLPAPPPPIPVPEPPKPVVSEAPNVSIVDFPTGPVLGGELSFRFIAMDRDSYPSLGDKKNVEEIHPSDKAAPNAIEYSWQLFGLDSFEWSPWSPNNCVDFMGVKAGVYEMRVRARDRAGNISEIARRPGIVVR